MFEGVRSASEPTLIVIAGQNGAGKSTTYRRVLTEIAPQPAVIDGDEIRTRHPAWAELGRTDPVLANEATYSDMKLWISECEAIAVERRCNVVIESTLRRLEPVIGTLETFRAAGYRCRLDVVGVPPEVSAVAIVARYEFSRRDNGFGRHVPLAIHDQAAAAITPHTAAIEDQGLVEEINVRSRTGEVVYTNQRASTGWEHPPAASAAVENLQQHLQPHRDATQRVLDQVTGLIARRSPTQDERHTLGVVTRRWNSVRARPRPKTPKRGPGPAPKPRPPNPRRAPGATGRTKRPGL